MDLNWYKRILFALIFVASCVCPIQAYVLYGLSENTYPINPENINNLLSSATILILFVIGLSGLLFQNSKKIYSKLRNILNILISILAIIIFSPLMAVIAILIKLDSPGPILYKQIRVGLNRRHTQRRHKLRVLDDRREENTLGHLFTVYKLRTMYVDSESQTGPVWAKENDNRSTKIGRFLRKTHLDEFPQFFNVLKGDMNIVGPRPERPEFVKMLNENILYYYRRYDIKPGITGLAQVRYHYTSSLTDTRNKIKYDLVYLRNWCFLMDLKIFFTTFSTVIFGKGAR